MISTLGYFLGMLTLVNNLFTELEKKKKNGTQKQPLAKCILVFMIRGLFTSLKLPYVHFPASSTKGPELFPIHEKSYLDLPDWVLRFLQSLVMT